MPVPNRVRELRTVPASSLIPNPHNWRRHPPVQMAALRGMLDEIGFADVLKVVETPDGLMILDGHARQDAMGDETVPVVVLDLTPEEAEKFLLTADPLAAMAEADRTALGVLLGRAETERAEVRNLLDSIADRYGAALGGPSGPETPFTPAGAEFPEPITRRRDLWLCGPHRVMCGDAFEARDMARLLAGAEPYAHLAAPFARHQGGAGPTERVQDDRRRRATRWT